MHAAGHTLSYPLLYLSKHLGKFSNRVKLQQVGGQKAREATPVSSPSSEQFNIVARAIYETVQPQQVSPCLVQPRSYVWHNCTVVLGTNPTPSFPVEGGYWLTGRAVSSSNIARC